MAQETVAPSYRPKVRPSSLPGADGSPAEIGQDQQQPAAGAAPNEGTPQVQNQDKLQTAAPPDPGALNLPLAMGAANRRFAMNNPADPGQTTQISPDQNPNVAKQQGFQNLDTDVHKEIKTLSTPTNPASPSDTMGATGMLEGFDRRFVTPTLGRVEDLSNQLKQNMGRMDSLKTAEGSLISKGMVPSGARRFGGIMSGIAAGFLSKNPLAGVKAYQDVTQAPARKQLAEYETQYGGIQDQNKVVMDQLAAERAELGFYGQQARFGQPMTRPWTDPATGKRYNIVTDRMGNLISKNEVGGGEGNIKVDDPAILAKHPDLAGVEITPQRMLELRREAAGPKEAKWQAISAGGGGRTWAVQKGDKIVTLDAQGNIPTQAPAGMSPEDFASAQDQLRAANVSYEKTQAENEARRKDLMQVSDKLASVRQEKLANIRQDLQNNAAPQQLKTQIPYAYQTRDMVGIVRNMMAQRPDLMGPIIGRLEKGEFKAGDSFGLQNPADERFAATLAGHLQWLYGAELRAVLPGRPQAQLAQEFKDVSARLTQNPNIANGFMDAELNNANIVINNGRRYGIDIDSSGRNKAGKGQGATDNKAPAAPGQGNTRPPLESFDRRKK